MFNHMECAFTVFKLNTDIVLFICPVQTNVRSKLISLSHHQLLFIGDWYAFHALRKKYSQQLSACPEYSLANVEHLLARKKSGDHRMILAQYS
uniref:Prophage integrase n=2 Tax=Enterobacterales TaxID=91347 RepID=B0RL46_YEREN|nr:prophage integrase [Yersinia enterocolitica]